MNIQRKYSLPNCTLLLEGLSDVTKAAHFQELRPELSILVNAECYLSSYSQPLAGGREFFESLVRAVSAYAQEFLSNVPNPQAHNQESELVELQKINSNRHRLIVHSEIAPEGFESNPNYSKQPPVQIDLNTVQLFDLVEAVDQFFADTQTLPELSLELQTVTRRYSGTSQALIKQAVPAAVGVSSLAAAAFAFSLIPAPQVRPPEIKPDEQASTTAPNVTPSPSAAAIPTPTTAPTEAAIPTPTTAPTEAAIPTPTITPIAAVTPIPSTAPATAATPVVRDLEALLTTVPEIADPSQLRALNRQVYNKIHPAWNNRSGFAQDLVYRLGVAADGEIVGYKAVNQGANEAIGQTPLPNLLYNPANRPPIANEAIAQFRVVFTKQGVLEVSPWRGYAKTPQVIGAKIADTNVVKDLNQKLYGTVRQSWSGTPTFTRDLKYRVAVNKDSVIADYEPLNQVAFDYFRETPLPKMFQAIYGSNVAAPNNKDALAHFQVVFKPNGTLEVTPWQGYR
ncbi:hypothetical protein Cylst_0209 [Cylindrospermum stagnale PCC 7417]|uniref:DUF4335 domain-containing protein n=1 Tax=Cylindrospermum stagnale PCC 7417 TaxID=56107 RepID=K9WS31_9NOST|nr:DUF4335 domain-containing protein [Cylindrospermum stagnale]AFZ22584.1 hypothetical protein Cylst_0209 [Cylindrospermum stagnale PCC 7417]